jgi:hypothetical protein
MVVRYDVSNMSEFPSHGSEGSAFSVRYRDFSDCDSALESSLADRQDNDFVYHE